MAFLLKKRQQRDFKMTSKFTAICKIKSGFAFIYMISDSRESALLKARKVISRQNEKSVLSLSLMALTKMI
ncbi:hypothetical protein CSU32_15340 [Salmonella enterica subsp. diarizonae]|nr:hypothetical protein [Salmonella enterica subsp. diarizonae]ECI3360080.1 hypothetical protein [Salmonella enterica subsp. diarizonae]